MSWLRKQPVTERRHGNPERTLANKIGDVRIFLKEFGITKLGRSRYCPSPVYSPKLPALKSFLFEADCPRAAWTAPLFDRRASIPYNPGLSAGVFPRI
jgi:hypothetical protein